MPRKRCSLDMELAICETNHAVQLFMQRLINV